MDYTNKDLIRAHKFSINNRNQIQNTNRCGCFFCKTIFSTTEFEDDDWIYGPGEELGTAICPYCMVDSIIFENSGYPITEEFMDAMYEFWFDSVDSDIYKEVEGAN